MDRINGQDTVDIGNGRRGFQGQNAAAGTPGTEVTDVHMNSIQEEIMKVIEAAGLEANGNDWTQLWQAIKKIAMTYVTETTTPLTRLNRLPFIPVVSNTTTTPPSRPVNGDVYLIPSNASGTWAGKGGQLAEYYEGAWQYLNAPQGHVIGLPDARLFVKIGTYTEFLATPDRAGLIELATIEEAAAKKDNQRAVTPLGLATVISKIGYQTIVFSDVGSTTWTVPEGVNIIDAQVWGAGGGGGGSYKAGASGGGGGGYIDCKGIQVTPGQKIIVTVGAGGAGGSAAPSNGGAGGASSVGNYATAYGGGGGYAANGTSTLSRAAGGKAIGSGLAVPGQDSQTAIVISSNYFMGGQGGGAYGTTNSIVSTSVRGSDGAYPGGGGCGDPNGFGGGKGANGLVAISFIKDSTT